MRKQRDRMQDRTKKTEHGRMLQRELQKLVRFKGKRAEIEWRFFFQEEFLPYEGEEGLLLLLEAVVNGGLSSDILRLIPEIMEERQENYRRKGEYRCEWIASEIIRSCREKLPETIRIEKKILKMNILTIIAGSVVIAILLLIAASRGELQGDQNPDKTIYASAWLNDKYHTKIYNIETLRTDTGKYGYGKGNGAAFYQVKTEASRDTIAYILENEEDRFHPIFDNIQEPEIKQALEERINEATGYEGRLEWNTSMRKLSGSVEDGYFHTTYEGDLDRFMRDETEVRKHALKLENAEEGAAFAALNGDCEYCISRAAIDEEEAAGEASGYLERTPEVSAALKECERKYQVAIRYRVSPE